MSIVIRLLRKIDIIFISPLILRVKLFAWGYEAERAFHSPL